MFSALEQYEKLRTQVEFDCPFEVGISGMLYPRADREVYAPEVYHVDGEQHPRDVEVLSDEWETFSVGYTGQWSYNGAVMHASEYLGGRLADDILTNPGVYVVVSVEDPDDHDSPAGWTVLKLKEA